MNFIRNSALPLLLSVFLLAAICSGLQAALAESEAAVQPIAQENENPFEAAIREFERKDKLRAPEPGCTVFVGSSTFTLWGDLEKQFSSFKAVNRGFGGSTLPDINHFVERIVNKYKPARVVLYAGTNDIAALKHSAKQVLADFKSFVSRVEKANPQAEIYFVSMSVAPSREQFNSTFEKGNELIQDYIKTEPHLHYIDVVPLMRNKNGDLRKELFGPDNLHMNQQGYKLWEPLIAAALKKAK